MGIGCGLLIYLAIAAAAFWAFWIVVRWLFFRPKVMPGDAHLITECTKCKYSLEGLGTSPTCPECSTFYPTIYTTHTHTEWALRRDLVWHWTVAALWCVGLLFFFTFAFPPVLTGLVCLSMGWPVGQRVEELMQSRVYPWQPAELTLTLFMAWIAACPLSHRCRVRTLSKAFALCGAAALLTSLVAAASSPSWVVDWCGYFWSRGGSPAPATFGVLSIITFLICMLIDATAQSDASREPLPVAAHVASNLNALSQDSVEQPQTHRSPIY